MNKVHVSNCYFIRFFLLPSMFSQFWAVLPGNKTQSFRKHLLRACWGWLRDFEGDGNYPHASGKRNRHVSNCVVCSHLKAKASKAIGA